MGFNLLKNGIYLGSNPLTNHLLTSSCDIQVNSGLVRHSSLTSLTLTTVVLWTVPDSQWTNGNVERVFLLVEVVLVV